MKKVAVLIHEHQYGGGTRQTFYILEELTRQQYDTCLISNAQETWLGSQLKETGLPVKTFYSPLIRRELNPIRDFRLFLHLIQIFQKEKPDTVLAAGVKLMGLGCLAAWVARVPNIYTVVRGQGASQEGRLIQVIYLVEKLLARLGTRYITVCEFNRQEFIEKQICSPEQVVTVHNGTDIQKLGQLTRNMTFRNQCQIPAHAFLIGMVGRLTGQKCYDRFISYIARLCQQNPDVYGLVIGEGPDRDKLQQQINDSGFSDRIQITGFIKDMSQVYSTLDLSVLFTEYEGCANALLESCAAGIPMLADDVCGNAEIVCHEQNGYVIQPGDEDSAVQYTQQLIDSPDLRSRFSAFCRQHSQQSFDRIQQVKKLIQVMASTSV